MTEQSLQERVLELENEISILTKFAEISASLNAQVSLKTLLKRIMDAAVQITSCEAASVLLWNNRKQALVFAASTTVNVDDSALIGTFVPMDSIAGQIFRENRIIQVDDTRQHELHYDKVDEDIQFTTRSLLGVPLTYNDKVIGVLEAINKREMPWTLNDRNYLSTLAAQAAVAIEGAKLVQDLRRANEELSEVDALKNNFIAIASHELRTPLGVIMGYASFLQEEESESAKEHASKVLESALKLRKIIEDMVNLRYLKQNASDLHPDTLSVNSLLSAVRMELFTLMDLSDYEFDFQMLEEDLLLYGDQARLQMALINIMHNAISFTPKGGKITMLAASPTPRTVEISVIDTGAGIETDQLERIFQEFYQVEDHMTRHHGGLGIGLSIARAIVHAHEGRIWAESEGLGTGATFTIALPLKTG
ncbi:MAG: GAF domain-containing protein [Anaerolineae bacterium]|nr:GAF domain-containing protein [Anaerolineae bacterium]